MKLYLVQHAKAASKLEDPQRSLTEEGRRDMQKVAAFVRPLKLSVDYLWHSGKKRAAQTAEFLVEAVEVGEGGIARDGLGPNDDVAMLKNELVSAQQDIMIVGHMPFLSKLTSLLLTGSESANTVALKNGSIVCLSRSEENYWQLDWMVTPELLV